MPASSPSSAASISSAKLLANRLNARRSTGPRTPGGKAIAAANSLKHGLFGRHLLLPGESAEELTQLKVSFLRRLNPRDPMELELVERVIAACWKLRRLQRFEATLVGRACQRWADDPNSSREANGLGRHQPVPVELAWQSESAEFRAQLERLGVQERQLEHAMRRTLRQLSLLQESDIDTPLTEFAAETVAGEQGTAQNRQNEATAAEELRQRARLKQLCQQRSQRLETARRRRTERLAQQEQEAAWRAEEAKYEARRAARREAKRQRRREQEAAARNPVPVIQTRNGLEAFVTPKAENEATAVRPAVDSSTAVSGNGSISRFDNSPPPKADAA